MTAKRHQPPSPLPKPFRLMWVSLTKLVLLTLFRDANQCSSLLHNSFEMQARDYCRPTPHPTQPPRTQSHPPKHEKQPPDLRSFLSACKAPAFTPVSPFAAMTAPGAPAAEVAEAGRAGGGPWGGLAVFGLGRDESGREDSVSVCLPPVTSDSSWEAAQEGEGGVQEGFGVGNGGV